MGPLFSFPALALGPYAYYVGYTKSVRTSMYSSVSDSQGRRAKEGLTYPRDSISEHLAGEDLEDCHSSIETHVIK